MVRVISRPRLRMSTSSSSNSHDRSSIGCCHAYLPSDHLHDQVVNLQRARLTGSERWPARQCMKARQELGEGKRLAEIVVGAGLEPLDPAWLG
jgi:hypothetical protein